MQWTNRQFLHVTVIQLKCLADILAQKVFRRMKFDSTNSVFLRYIPKNEQ
jgi:hypothetical protein